MNRQEFINLGCSCGILSYFFPHIASGQNENLKPLAKKHIPQEMNHEQVKNILKFIDASCSESIKESIFGQLGNECFYSRNLDKWIETYTDDVQGFLDRVNIENKSTYWERLEFNADRTVLELTGKKVVGCACAFADCSQPPKSLCTYCCKNFQQELFGTLLGRQVRVEITEAFLLGDNRCNTLIYIVA
jgi:predicted ArsR family transcriptional regulator